MAEEKIPKESIEGVDDIGIQNLDEVLQEGNDAGAKQIKNLADATEDQDALTKKQFDDNQPDLQAVLDSGNTADKTFNVTEPDPTDDWKVMMNLLNGNVSVLRRLFAAGVNINSLWFEMRSTGGAGIIEIVNSAGVGDVSGIRIQKSADIQVGDVYSGVDTSANNYPMTYKFTEPNDGWASNDRRIPHQKRVQEMIDLAVGSAADVKNFYVDSQAGDDNNPGTHGAPWATIQKYIDTAADGDVCNLLNINDWSSETLTVARAGQVLIFKGIHQQGRLSGYTQGLGGTLDCATGTPDLTFINLQVDMEISNFSTTGFGFISYYGCYYYGLGAAFEANPRASVVAANSTIDNDVYGNIVELFDCWMQGDVNSNGRVILQDCGIDGFVRSGLVSASQPVQLVNSTVTGDVLIGQPGDTNARFDQWNSAIGGTVTIEDPANHNKVLQAPEVQVDHTGYWYVDTDTGNDSNNGKNPATQFATVGAAVAQAADGDVIIVAPGDYSAEPTIDIDKGLLFRGGGNTGFDTDTQLTKLPQFNFTLEGVKVSFSKVSVNIPTITAGAGVTFVGLVFTKCVVNSMDTGAVNTFIDAEVTRFGNLTLQGTSSIQGYYNYLNGLTLSGTGIGSELYNGTIINFAQTNATSQIKLTNVFVNEVFALAGTVTLDNSGVKTWTALPTGTVNQGSAITQPKMTRYTGFGTYVPTEPKEVFMTALPGGPAGFQLPDISGLDDGQLQLYEYEVTVDPSATLDLSIVPNGADTINNVGGNYAVKAGVSAILRPTGNSNWSMYTAGEGGAPLENVQEITVTNANRTDPIAIAEDVNVIKITLGTGLTARYQPSAVTGWVEHRKYTWVFLKEVQQVVDFSVARTAGNVGYDDDVDPFFDLIHVTISMQRAALEAIGYSSTFGQFGRLLITDTTYTE